MRVCAGNGFRRFLLLLWQHVLGTGRAGGEGVSVVVVLFILLGREEVDRSIPGCVFVLKQGVGGSAAGRGDEGKETLRCRRR